MDDTIGKWLINIGKFVAYCKAKYYLGYSCYAKSDDIIEGRTITWF